MGDGNAWRATTVASLVVLIAVAVGVATEAALGVPTTLTQRLDQLAYNSAASWGDSSVSSVTWVRAPEAAAARVVTGDQLDAKGDAYVLEMKGEFNGPVGPKAAPGARNVYRVLTLFVDAVTLKVDGVSLSNTYTSLSGFGHTETDSLMGFGVVLPPPRRPGRPIFPA